MQIIQPEIGLIFWSAFILCILCLWILTLVNIAKSNFINPDIKMVWGLLVFFLPLIGTILYYSIGRNQRINNR